MLTCGWKDRNRPVCLTQLGANNKINEQINKTKQKQTCRYREQSRREEGKGWGKMK